MNPASLALVALLGSGLDGASKRDLYDAGLRYRAQRDEARIMGDACALKLATRTSTVINQLTMPAPAAPEPDAAREYWFAGGVAVGVLAAIGVGFALKPAR